MSTLTLQLKYLTQKYFKGFYTSNPLKLYFLQLKYLSRVSWWSVIQALGSRSWRTAPSLRTLCPK